MTFDSLNPTKTPYVLTASGDHEDEVFVQWDDEIHHYRRTDLPPADAVKVGVGRCIRDGYASPVIRLPLDTAEDAEFYVLPAMCVDQKEGGA